MNSCDKPVTGHWAVELPAFMAGCDSGRVDDIGRKCQVANNGGRIRQGSSYIRDLDRSWCLGLSNGKCREGQSGYTNRASAKMQSHELILGR